MRMKLSKIRSLALVAALLVAGPVLAGSKDEQGRWIVVYKSGVSLQSAGSKVSALGGQVTRQLNIVNGVAVSMSAAAVEQLRRDPAVAYVEPDGIAYAQGTVSGSVKANMEEAQIVPYGIDMVKAPQAWAKSRGAGVRVAVLDTGIDLNHPDNGNLLLTKSFIPGETVQDGGGHGTHVAGTVAAADNGLGVVGVAPDADLLIGKVLSNAGSGSYSGIIAGVDWAVASGANVINMSLGGTAGSAAMETAINNATAAGVLVVVAAGNSNTSAPHYPAYYTNSFAVGSLTETKARSDFSNFGSWVDIAAPGSDVLSNVPVGTGQQASASWLGSGRDANGIQGAASGTSSGTIVHCGLGKPGEFPAGVAGNIAHIRRGEISFKDKVLNAQAAGAKGVILSNNAPGNFNGTLGDGVTSTAVAVSVSQSDGDSLVAAGNGVSGTVSMVASDYAKYSGTSMASPHVAGVAALVFAASSTGTVSGAQVRTKIESTADAITTDKPVGKLINAQKAVN
jgi:serine protease